MEGKTALITNTQTGLGSALAEAFGSRVNTLFLHCTGGEKERAEIENKLKSSAVKAKAVYLSGDLSTEQGCLECAEGLEATGANHLDVLVNIPITYDGLREPETPIRNGFDWKKATKIFSGNTFSVAKLTALFVPKLENSKKLNKNPSGGSIVNISHTAKNWTWGPQKGIWASSLAAVDAMTRYQALELAPNIRVNCVSAGYAEKEWAPAIPLKRSVNHSDIVHAVLYLADEPFVTGQTIDVNGGVRMQ